MHCPACGKTLARRTKYCTHCGEQLRQEEMAAVERLEKRFDDYVDGLFWTAFLGLGAIIGGTVLLKGINKELQFGPWLIIGYLALSSLAFLTVFGICLWQVIVLAKRKRQVETADEAEQFDTNELVEAKAPRSLGEAVSIAEETTRTLEARPKESIPR